MICKNYKYVEFKELLGKTIVDIKINECISEEPFETTDATIFTIDNGAKYILHHFQECCESVRLEELIGNLDDLLNSPITLADLVIDNSHHQGEDSDDYDGTSYTWSFYKLATVKGYVTMRFYGGSNGYYSETMAFVRLQDNQQENPQD